MKLRIKNSTGLPVPDATVMVTEAPAAIHDIAALTNEDGFVNLADYVIPGKYTVVVSHNGDSSIHSVDLQGSGAEIDVVI